MSNSVNVHELKIWPESFEAVLNRRKTYEIHKADRPFAVDDILILREWNPDVLNYTGRMTIVTVTYITHPSTFGLPSDLCVMAIVPHYNPVRVA